VVGGGIAGVVIGVRMQSVKVFLKICLINKIIHKKLIKKVTGIKSAFKMFV
jgi:hypothetical protein